VDLETDKAIQEIIRGPQFCNVTMVTIARGFYSTWQLHGFICRFFSDRLNTILESDRILVLNEGSVAELDTPVNLLANPKTIFHSLASEAGLVGSSVTPRDEC
jgi:ATP-binding cassette subfamily C (CFTR/MRP) protein 1